MESIPFVVVKDGRSERAYDIYSRLLQDRIIFVRGAITDENADAVVAQLMFLNSTDSGKDVHVYINSPGGSISAGLAIYDIMQHVGTDVNTYCIGQAASMGSILLCGGTKGKRHILPNGRVLIHQPLINGVFQGQTTDLEIEANEILRLRENLYNILAIHTGQDISRIEKDCDRNTWLNAEQAIAYGCVDKIVGQAHIKPGI